MRQTHAAGEKAFVDYSGKRVPVIIDPLTGEIREAEIFVGVLGASNLTYAEATWTQTLPDWIGAHVRAFEAIGGVPELVVPDNARTAIVKASFYDPQAGINIVLRALEVPKVAILLGLRQSTGPPIPFSPSRRRGSRLVETVHAKAKPM